MKPALVHALMLLPAKLNNSLVWNGLQPSNFVQHIWSCLFHLVLSFSEKNSIVFRISLFPRFLSICHCHLFLYWSWYLSLIYSWTVVHTETLIDGEPILKLPAKTIQLSKIDFTPEERAFYVTLEEGSRQKFKVPSTLHHLSSVGYKLNCLSMMFFFICNHGWIIFV